MILAKKEKGKYKAFPTVVKVGSEVLVAFREGLTEPSKPHGKNGKVKILKSIDLKNWQEFETPFNDNELDAILSGPFGDDLYLVTRSFEHKKRNDIYVSRFKIGNLPQDRLKVTVSKVRLSAFFGHMFERSGELVATAYGMYKDEHRSLVLSSADKGNTWQLKGVIMPDGFKPWLNENSIVEVDGKFLSIIRSLEPSYDLYYSFSSDLVHWDEPKKLGLLGHAPVLRKLKSGKLALAFRDLNDNLPGIGLALSDDGINWERINLKHYRGNLYEGGYTDFIEIEDNKLFVVYYISDEDNEPWIEAEIVNV